MAGVVISVYSRYTTKLSLSRLIPGSLAFVMRHAFTGPAYDRVGSWVTFVQVSESVAHQRVGRQLHVVDVRAFALQKAISTTIRDFGHDYWTGTVYTTNRRVWDWDEDFKTYLRKIRAQAIDMETATIFTTAFHNKIPTGALLLVSDQPMVPEGVKTEISDFTVTKNYVEIHLKVGIESLKQLINNGITVKHLRY